jgi:hypothetical protein
MLKPSKPHLARRYGANGIVFEHVLEQWIGTRPGMPEVIVAWLDVWGSWVAYRTVHAPGSSPDHPIVHKAVGRGFRSFSEMLERWEELPPMEPHRCNLGCVGVDEEAA